MSYHVTQLSSGGIPGAPLLWHVDKYDEREVEDYLASLASEGYVIGTHDLGESFDLDVARPSQTDWSSDDEVRHWIITEVH